MRYFLFCSLLICNALGASEVLTGFNKDQLDEDEAGMWMVVEKEEQRIRTSSIYLDDPGLHEHINDILCDVVGESCSYLRPYVIRAAGFNAFMMPNGAFFIQSGMLLRTEDDDQLAAIIGHEASHYFRGHTLESVRKTHRTNTAFAMVGAVLTAASGLAATNAASYDTFARYHNLSNAAASMVHLAQIAAVFQLLKYSRDMELEADADGVTWMQQAGYDSSVTPSMWQDVINEQAAGGDDAGFSLLSTHPSPKKRIETLNALISDSGGAGRDTPKDGDTIKTLIAAYQDDWIVDEMRTLHPDQFKHVLAVQVARGYPKHRAAYLEGISYSNMAKDEKSEKKQAAFYKSAIAAFNNAINHGGTNTKHETYRDLGKAYEAVGNIEGASRAYSIYLERAPDAWDARVISRKIVNP